ncbi:MAG: hypothetical protein COA55_16725 [Alcanivorax sp.]|nr:AMP-binding protein [Alcanivorax sp.]PHR63296.1 MAG: hypothetical protein COA55_16725 [Alcanivorax sp.]
MGTSITYGELDHLSRKFASYLQNDLGFKKGDRIALMMPNVLQYPVAMMAVLRDAGAQPLSPSAWPEEGVTLEEGALVRDGETVLTAFGLRAAGRAQLGILRDAYPPIESEAEYRRAERIDFYDLYAEGDWDCRVLPDRQTLFRQEQRLILVKLRCEDT